MKNKLLVGVLMVSLMGFLSPAADGANSGFLPKRAREVAPGVFSLGQKKDPKTGKMAEGLAIVHYKKEKARGGAAKPGKTAVCYGFLAKGAKWKVAPEPWVMNPENPDNMPSTTVFSIISQGIDKWEDAADGEVITGSVDIFGSGSAVDYQLAAGQNLNGVNEVAFSNLNDPGVIAVTTVWGNFSGPTFARELVEWDMQFNTQFIWTTNALAEPDKMDLDNIGTHELGHAFGLADLYTASCTDETMYGYGTEGEIKKRDLNSGDIAGISELY